MKHVYTVDLSPRENRHWQDAPVADVFFIVQIGLLCFVCVVIAWLVML